MALEDPKRKSESWSENPGLDSDPGWDLENETGGFGIGLSEWRRVRVEEFGFEFEFGLGVFRIKAFEVGIGERGREEGKEEEEEEDGKERKEVK
jgi:hypothetical protein